VYIPAPSTTRIEGMSKYNADTVEGIPVAVVASVK
jgi:hypothetical protein